MDIREFDVFLKVCKAGNISRAASEICISQQGLSKMIQRWERDFGVPLFRRGHTGIELTHFGEILREHAMVISAEFTAAINCIEKSTSIRNSLLVTVDLGVYSIFPPDVFISFRDTYSNIELIVQEHTEGTNRRYLTEEKAELCIALAPAREEFDFIPFYDVEGRVLVSREDPLSEKDFVTVEDLRTAKLIVLGSACNYAYVRACRHAGFEPYLVISGIEMSDPMPYIRTNYGICTSFAGLLPEPEESDNAVILPFDSEKLWSIGFLCKKNKKLSVAAKLFMDHMIGFASNNRFLF